MEQQMILGQAFWGSDKDGYHILGISETRYRDIIEKLCLSIGTPDGLSEIKPFLISRLEGNTVFMACCRNGRPDTSHRKTLFFHVLFGDRSECDRLHISAFSLFRNGFFVSEPTADCNPMKVPAFQPTANHRPPFAWNQDNLAIVAKSPQNELIENLVGGNANRYSWAAFTFSDLPQYKVFAVSEFVLAPKTRICRDTNGKIIFTPEREAAPNIQNPEPPVRRKSWAVILLLISVLLNVFLLFLLIQRNPVQNTKIQDKAKPIVQIKTVTKTIQLPGPSEDDVRKKLIARWAADFPAESRIPDWNAAMGKEGDPLHDMNKPTSFEYPVFCKLRRYVDFVNKNILQIPNEEKIK